jgi:hypothetical protein
VKFGSLEITGRATFKGGFVADTLVVPGETKIVKVTASRNMKSAHNPAAKRMALLSVR